jgi:DNA-binding NtrC family response regulator
LALSPSWNLPTDSAEEAFFLYEHPGFPPVIETNFSLKRAVLEYEAHFIKLALQNTHGDRKEAAGLLGLKSRQGLISMLKGRHKELRDFPTPVAARRRSIIRRQGDADLGTTTVRVLHVEDDETVAGLVKEMLEEQGWQVETCADGNAALEKISGQDDYDVLVVDNDLPGVDGLELINRAREMDHRCDTPMVVLAANPVEAAAREAGADVLQKPQGIGSLVETVNRLLEEGEQEQ